ncbi:MAG: serine/threonine-protein phosphatase [Ignavibacteriales bacterium]|nr:serine/threonine-protein phosphatase [Ignavibacteriales bacterium]
MAGSYYSESDFGKKRRIQEDSHFADVPTDPSSPISHVILVADGMGGQSSGEIASSIARDVMKMLFIESKYIVLAQKAGIINNGNNVKFFKDVLREAVHYTHQKIKSASHSKNMGTTCTVAIVLKNNSAESDVIIGHVGDSRAYKINQGKITQITEDDSVVWSLYKSGQISKDQLRSQKGNNVITQALGGENLENPHIYNTKTSANDLLLLCSDGLHGLLGDKRIYSLVSTSKSLEEISRKLINAANSAGGKDNISVALYSNSFVKKTPEKRKVLLPILLTSFGIILLSTLIYFGIKYFEKSEAEDYKNESDIKTLPLTTIPSDSTGPFNVVLNYTKEAKVDEMISVNISIQDKRVSNKEDLKSYLISYQIDDIKGKNISTVKKQSIQDYAKDKFYFTGNTLVIEKRFHFTDPGNKHFVLTLTRPTDKKEVVKKFLVNVIKVEIKKNKIETKENKPETNENDVTEIIVKKDDLTDPQQTTTLSEKDLVVSSEEKNTAPPIKLSWDKLILVIESNDNSNIIVEYFTPDDFGELKQQSSNKWTITFKDRNNIPPEGIDIKIKGYKKIKHIQKP